MNCSASIDRLSATGVVTRNFFWRTIDLLVSILGAFATSIALARIIGPTRLGYFNYVYWLTSITGSMASLGIPAAALKYMAESLGRKDGDSARAVYSYCLRNQIACAVALSGLCLIVVFETGARDYRWISAFLVLSIIPQMIAYIPSQANVAAEDIAPNTHASIAGAAVNVLAVLLSLALGWDLLGVSIGVFLYRTLEALLKFRSAHWIYRFRGMKLAPLLKRRLVSFGAKSFILLLLQIVIWDRSDIVLLKFLQTDLKQIAFFSVAFSLSDRLMLLPQALGSALHASQMAQYGRDKERLFRMTAASANYLALLGLPLLVGAACVSAPTIRLLYGVQYMPAIPVFAIVALFAVSKCMLSPAQSLLYSTEDLNFMLGWGCACGLLNLVVDLSLIPHFAAIGAAIGNGCAQTAASAGFWWYATKRFGLQLRIVELAKVVLATTLMAATIACMFLAVHLPAVFQLCAGIIIGAATFIVTLRMVRALQLQDKNRLLMAGRSIPRLYRGTFEALVDFLAPIGVDTGQ